MQVPTIEWAGELPGRVRLIDQTLLPGELKVLDLQTPEEMWGAIRRLSVRGAPAIGIAAAFGLMLGIQDIATESTEEFASKVREVSDYLRTARPTAVNLFWALDRMEARLAREPGLSVAEQKNALWQESLAILEEDKDICRRIGEHGASLVGQGDGVLTHCNAGGLATSVRGTALSVFYAAHEQGTKFRVFADETRPLLQGARLTSWELVQAGIDCTLICDNMAGLVMREGKVQSVVVGADRIAANGDTANKIGTYSVAVLAKEHGVPFYVAAPTSTFDLQTADGTGIPIEERTADEVTAPLGVQSAAEGVEVYNPAFDVTPHPMIRGIITEFGVIEAPSTEAVRAFFSKHCPDRLSATS